jgi:hypothetical protein
MLSDLSMHFISCIIYPDSFASAPGEYYVQVYLQIAAGNYQVVASAQTTTNLLTSPKGRFCFSIQPEETECSRSRSGVTQPCYADSSPPICSRTALTPSTCVLGKCPHGAGPAWAQGRLNNDDLHPRAQTRTLCSEKPAGCCN